MKCKLSEMKVLNLKQQIQNLGEGRGLRVDVEVLLNFILNILKLVLLNCKNNQNK